MSQQLLSVLVLLLCINRVFSVLCGENEAQCDDGKCVPASWICDGDNDCIDESDEKKCIVPAGCKPGQFQCTLEKASPVKCIPESWRCDDEDDCPEGNDELDCKTGCSSEQKLCPGSSSSCINKAQFCDGLKDCLDGSDERNCSSTTAAPTCGPDQFDCNWDGSKCIAQDLLCDERDDCGNFNDERNCNIILIVSTRSDFRQFDTTTKHSGLVLNVSNAITFDLDIADNVCFGAEDNIIFSANLTTQVTQTIPTKPVKTLEGLALDWVHDNLYITDAGSDRIIVSRIDGNISKVLVSDGLDEPRAIVVDPYHGWMYWTDWGNDPKIEKCGLNGRERRAIVTTNIVWPNGLAIDYVDNRLYWVDGKLDQIGSIDTNGNNFRLVSANNQQSSHPFSIAVFEDYIYWTDWIDGSVKKMNKFGRGNITTVMSQTTTLYWIRVKHIDTQPEKINHCGEDNGGCSHLCLPIPQAINSQITRKSECACPDEMTLKDDRTCVDAYSQ